MQITLDDRALARVTGGSERFTGLRIVNQQGAIGIDDVVVSSRR